MGLDFRVPRGHISPFLRRNPMSFTIYDASAPVFAHALTNIQNWLDKA